MKPKKKVRENILYTGKGDNGKTSLYHCDQGCISKNTNIIEALGSLDELNAYLGIVKVYSVASGFSIQLTNNNIKYKEIIDNIQQNLFIIQAELAGSDMGIDEDSLKNIEEIIKQIGDVLPPITSFTISGGSILSAEIDYSRTLARKAERRMVAVLEEAIHPTKPITISYLNRLSSLLFAMSRYVNYSFSIQEEHPKYNKR